MEKIKLTYSHNDAVANITMCDGKGNIIDNIMMLEILDSLNEIGENRNIKLIVFDGEGRNFSFGASVEEHTKELAEMMLKTFHKIFLKIIELQIPTLSKISGQCLGGGLELALICDFMFADKTARLGQPEIVLGVFPPPASIILPEKIGLARAEELLITGRTIDAEEGVRIGLLNYVFDNKTELDTRCDEWIVKSILPKSASSLRYSVRAARIKFNHVIGNFLPQLQYIYLKQLMETNDANEGINSFIDKRKPVWENS